MKRRLQSKPLVDINCDRENLVEKNIGQSEKDCNVQVTNMSNRLTEEGNIKIAASVTSSIKQDEQSLGFGQRKDDGRLFEVYTSNISSNTRHDENEKKDVSIAVADNSMLHTTNAESCTGSLTSDMCNETDRNFILNKDYGFRKTYRRSKKSQKMITETIKSRERVRKDVHSISERRFISNAAMKKRQHDNTSSETCESRVELENHEILCRKDSETKIVSRKHHNTNGLPRKRQQKTHSENSDSEIEQHHRLTKDRFILFFVLSRTRQFKALVRQRENQQRTVSNIFDINSYRNFILTFFYEILNKSCSYNISNDLDNYFLLQ